MPEFQNTINGPFLVEFEGQTHVCVQVVRNATSGAELHEIDGQLLEEHRLVGHVQHQGATTPLYR